MSEQVFTLLWRIGPDGPVVSRSFDRERDGRWYFGELAAGTAPPPERFGGFRALVQEPRTILLLEGIAPEDLAMSVPKYDYPNLRRVVYGQGATFIPVCPKCGRFVRADGMLVNWNEGKPNATCKRCGRVEMPFEGYC